MVEYQTILMIILGFNSVNTGFCVNGTVWEIRQPVTVPFFR